MHFSWETVVYAIAAFLILYWLLNRYAFGPLFKMLEQRTEHIKQEIVSAEHNREQSEKLLAEQKAAIEQARKEAYDIIEQSRVTSAKQAEDIIRASRDESTRLKNEAMKEIEHEKNRAIVALRNEVSAMSVLIASKIIEKQIDETSQKEVIDHYLKEVGGNQ